MSGSLVKNENSNRKEDKNEILQLDVLKVAHHGSRGATSAEFLQHVQADTALISAGINNTYGHPHAELLQRLSDCGMRVLRTDEGGEISVREERGKMVIRIFSQDK